MIEEKKITKSLGVPVIFNGLLARPDLKKFDLSSLKEIIIGGAPSPLSLIVALEKKLDARLSLVKD